MRTRLLFSKATAMRYTGHLDLHRTWERILRRAGLPLAYSQGFNPHPRINLAAALPLGFTSECELVDFWLENEMDPENIRSALEPALPPGIQVHTIEPVGEREPALQTQVRAADYVVTLLDPLPGLAQRLEALLAAPALPRERRGKPYDLRPLISALQILPNDASGCQRFLARLSASESAAGRPEEVLAELGVPIEAARVHRTRLLFAEASAPVA